VNLAITLSQQRDRRGRDSLDEYERRAGHEVPADDDPSRVAEQRELEAAVGRALSELPDGMREVFVLRTFDDLSYQEISEVLGLPKGTVMSRLARARERVRERLGPFLETARGSEAEAGR
jgi:RNA polymerase sigma-70 factor (ECF subfamily)